MYVYPQIKRNLLPTQKQLERIQELADDDNAISRDVRPLMSVLMRLRRADPRLRGHILTRKTAVSSFSWNIVPVNPTPTQSEIAQAERAKLRCTPLIREVIQHRLQASLYDVMVIETAIDRLTPLGAVQTPIRRFRPVQLEKTTDYEVSILSQEFAKKVELVLPVAIGSPKDERASYIIAISDDDERGGLLRSIALHEVMLWDMVKEWANFNKKLKGIIQAIYMDGALPEEIASAIESTRQLAQNNYSATSDLIEFKFNQMTQSGAGLSFKDMIETLKSDITLTLLGQANTAELPKNGGSRAALQVLNLIRSDIMFDDMTLTENCINTQVLLNDARLNYNANFAEAPYKFEFSMPDSIDPETRSRIILDAFNAGVDLLKTDLYDGIAATAPNEQTPPDAIIRKQSAMP